ncbi:MAG: DUF599 family protein [Lentilitoribacter sp.]
MTDLDYIAFVYFLFCWFGFSVILRLGRLTNKVSLSDAMDEHRRGWFITASRRELRMIDTGIVSGLQSGVGFFASTTMIAIGGCLAALGSAEKVTMVFAEIPITEAPDILIIEAKLAGLIIVLGYTFFKFGWSYRLFNYCGILLGAMPMRDEKNANIETYAQQAGEMNVLAGRHFNAGQRGIFFAVGYLGCFVGPETLILTTTLVLLVLIRRQFYSKARQVALSIIEAKKAAQ